MSPRKPKATPTLPSPKCRAEVMPDTTPSPTFGGGGPSGPEGVPRDPSFALLDLESALDRINEHLLRASEPDELMRLARALSVCTTALFHAHRIHAALSGASTPLDDALKALGELDFDED